jgi:hypothetical protein
MTDRSKAAHPFHARPIIGKLKFVLAKVQAQLAQLPKDRQTPRLRLHLLNKELEFYHLKTYDWAEFVNFVRMCPVDNKALSHLLRHARWEEQRYIRSYESARSRGYAMKDRDLNQHNRWAFVIEEIKCAVIYRVPFRMLKLEYRFGREIDLDDVGYDTEMIHRREKHYRRMYAIQEQGQLIEFAKQRGLSIPIR